MAEVGTSLQESLGSVDTATGKKTQLHPFLTTYTRLNSKQVRDLDVKAKTINNIRRKYWQIIP